LALVFGFLEVVMWLFAVGQTMQTLGHPACYIAFAAGFTTGNFLGLQIERRLALGTVVLRLITGKDPSELLEQFHCAGYGVTVVEGQGATGPVKVVLTVVPRRELPALTPIIKAVDPKMFYSIDEIQSALEGIFPMMRGRGRPFLLFRPRLTRAA